MPQMKKMATPPPEPPKRKNSGIVGRNKGFNSQQIKDPSLRRRPITSDIYGEELLKPFKKEKEIVICFYPFTKNNLRISTNGKFVIERFSVEELEILEDGEQILHPNSHWNLYYYKESINFTAPNSLEEFSIINYTLEEPTEKFSNFDSDIELSNKIIDLVKAEYLEERKKKVEDLQEQDRLERERLDKEEEELENVLEESSFKSEISGETQASKEQEEILSKASQEENRENI